MMVKRQITAVSSDKPALRRVIASVAIVFLFEVLVFNSPYWDSLFYSDYCEMSINPGGSMQKTGERVFKTGSAGDSYLEFDCGGIHIDNVEIQLGTTVNKSKSFRQRMGDVVPLHLWTTDAGHSQFMSLPITQYCSEYEDTHYIRVHLQGETTLMRLYIDMPDKEFSVEKIAVNSIRPFRVSLMRVLLLALVVILIQLFRPSSKLYAIPFDFANKSTRVCTVVLLCASMVSIALLTQLVGAYSVPEQREVQYANGGGYALDFNHYNHMADSILSGELSLDLPVSDTLKALENPYDSEARKLALQETGEHAFMDYAYYEGKYYSYFGVLPALLVFVPYKLVTGLDLRTDYCVALFAALCMFSLILLLAKVYKRYFPEGSLGLFLLGAGSLLSGSGIVGLAYLPTTYSIPLLSALFFSSLGVSFWFGASNGGARLSRKHLVAGSICIALTLACRPLMVLTAVLAFPIFWNEITRLRLFFAPTKEAVINTTLVILPFIIVAAPIMGYNWARFDSPFDFGATYNLTGADMTNRGFDLARIPGCLFEYLLQPLNVNLVFPFIHGIDMRTDFQGQWFFEPFTGGFIAYSPICLVLFFLFSLKKKLDQLGVFGLSCVAAILALVLLVLDFQVASITPRYFGDFGWLMLLATWMIVWSVLYGIHVGKSGSSKGQNCIMVSARSFALLGLVFFGVFLVSWSLLSEGRYSAMVNTCPSIYYAIKSWISILF